MVARTVIDQRYRTFDKWIKATVVNDIWPELLFFTLVATMVTLVTEKTNTSLAVSNQMLTVLGIVLGLVVSFRTSSAYDRFWEGRKLWTAINLASRNLAHMIWIHVPNGLPERKNLYSFVTNANDHASDSKEAQLDPAEVHLRAIIEKKTMINLVQAFSVAVKHMLRGEPGIYYRDLYPLVCYLPRYATESAHIHESEAHDHELPLFASSVKIRRVNSAPEAQNGEDDSDEKTERMAFALRNGKIKTMKKRAETFDPEQVLPQILPDDGDLLEARNPPKSTIYDYFPILHIFKPIVAIVNYPINKLRRNTNFDIRTTLPGPSTAQAPAMSKPLSTASRATHVSSATHATTNSRATTTPKGRDALGRKKRPARIDSNVPLEITLFLSTYLAWLQRNGLLSPAIATALTNNLASLQDTMANLDRIRTTPIPFAYQAHLRMTMWLYLFFLPFQVYTAFGYLTIPATAFASYLLLGFLEIGQEIEDPFGYDMNDLDLDHFCLNIERELHEITAHPAPDPETFIFGPDNQPFAPGDRRSAQEMLDAGHKLEYLHEEKGKTSLRRTLLKSWKEVADKTVER